METILAGKRPPSPTTKKRKPPMKVKSSRFDSLVARYYPAVYSFASRLTDDPREANALTRNAFRSAQKQLCSLRDQTAVATILISAVIRVGPGRRLICAAAGSGDRHVT